MSNSSAPTGPNATAEQIADDVELTKPANDVDVKSGEELNVDVVKTGNTGAGAHAGVTNFVFGMLMVAMCLSCLLAGLDGTIVRSMGRVTENGEDDVHVVALPT